MREELQTVLEDYLNRFEHNLAQVHRSQKSSSFLATQEVVNLTEEQLRDGFATGQAIPSGEEPSSMGSGIGDDAAAAGGSAAVGAGSASAPPA
jgi:hypothetical protein